jgi:Lysophospholipase L1 and related esterases
MKHIKTLFLTALAILNFTISYAQDTTYNPLKNIFPVIQGRAWQSNLQSPYSRLPLTAKETIREAVWDLSQNSAGLYIKFRSNANKITIKYTVSQRLSMPHMPATGVSGLDLYALDNEGKQRWCAAKFNFSDTITYTYNNLYYTSSAPHNGYEYTLYLPLYNTVNWLEITTAKNSNFSFLPISNEKPIVVYGTSIAQGACASRPGMAWSNILERELEYPIINLGFSGNGRLEKEVFDLLAQIDAKLYIIDCNPNLSGIYSKEIFDRIVKGVNILRSKNNAPILLVEHSGYTNDLTCKEAENSYRESNKELFKSYEFLKEKNFKDIYYLTKEEIGFNLNSMVEGVHPNDLGMREYANAYSKKIKGIFKFDTTLTQKFTPCRQQRDSYNWNERHNEVLALNKTNPPQIVLIGNSITHFWAGEPSFRIARGEKSWKKLFKGKVVRNMGFGWDRLENALWRVNHEELDGYNAEKIFVLMGTNNLERDTDDEIIYGLNALLSSIYKKQPQAQIYVCAILPRKNLEERIAKLNQRIESLISNSPMKFVPMHTLLTLPSGKIDPTLFPDGLHPNAEGYKKMGEMMEWAVKE